MAKKVVNIVKKGKEQPKKSDEIFNLNEEIIIGINNKTAENKGKKTKSSKAKSKTNKKTVNNKSKNKKSTNNKKHINQEEKETKKSHTAVKIFIIIFLLIIAIVALLLSPVFSIQTVTVKNNSKVSNEEIINLSGIQLGDNTFKYINIEMMEKIKTNPYIEDVKITRKYPSEIIIEVTERKLEYFFTVNNEYVYINSQGYIVEKSKIEYEVPEIKGFKTVKQEIILGNRLLEEDLHELEKIIEIYKYAVNNEIEDEIISFKIEKDRIVINLKKDKKAYIKNFTNVNFKISSLKLILEKNKNVAGEIFLDGQGESGSVLFREEV